MPSKIRKAIAAVKDQTSIGLVKVSKSATCGSANLDVAVLKATAHDEVPIKEKYINEVLLLTSSSQSYAISCVQALSRRIDRTRNWVVAVKSLCLVFRALQDGGPYFPREAITAMRCGAPLLNLSGFSDESDPISPWDYTAFVRTFALYLDERLQCTVHGKIQSHRRTITGRNRLRNWKPPVILDRVSHWQRLLDRAFGTRPTGPAKNHRIVQISLYSVLRESFDLYRDISDGLALLLDSFFQLPHKNCVETHRLCAKAAKQFQELDKFYHFCRSIGVGRKSEYPDVQKFSDEVLETLNEFISNSKDSSKVVPTLLLQTPPMADSDVASSQGSNLKASSEEDHPAMDGKTQNSEQKNILTSDMVLLDERPVSSTDSCVDEWELVLAETASDISSQANQSFTAAFEFELLPERSSDQGVFGIRRHHGNPFLHDMSESSCIVSSWSSPSLSLPPPPTFCAEKADDDDSPALALAPAWQPKTDHFSSSQTSLHIQRSSPVQTLDASRRKQLLIQEQQLWMRSRTRY